MPDDPRESDEEEEELSSPKENGDDAAPSGTLESRATRGAVWTILSHGGGQVLRLVGNLVLTRLLFRESFGIMALVTVFLVGLALFSDIGIGPSIIQNKRGDKPGFLNTAWTIQVARGALLWLIACAGALPFASIYGEPILAWIVPISGTTALIQGLGSTKLFTQNRKLALGRLAILEIASQALGLVTMVVWALIDRSIWALVAGGVVQSLSKTLLSHLVLQGIRNRFHWNREDAKSLITFGRWIFVSTVLTFLAQQTDKLIFGKMIPMALFGVYHIGFSLASIPQLAFKRLSARIFFPFFSRVNDGEGDVLAAFSRLRWAMLVAMGWLLSGLIAGGTTIIDILYDDRYAEAGWIVQLISIGCWFGVITDTYAAVLLSQARTGLIAVANATKFVTMVILITLGHHYFGFPGAVAGITASELLRMLVSAIASARIRFPTWSQDLILTAMVAAASLGGALADSLVDSLGGHVILRAVAVFAAVSLAWLPLGLRLYRNIKREGSPFKA